jgi:hypothetical protein
MEVTHRRRIRTYSVFGFSPYVGNCRHAHKTIEAAYCCMSSLIHVAWREHSDHLDIPEAYTLCYGWRLEVMEKGKASDLLECEKEDWEEMCVLNRKDHTK